MLPELYLSNTLPEIIFKLLWLLRHTNSSEPAMQISTSDKLTNRFQTGVLKATHQHNIGVISEWYNLAYVAFTKLVAELRHSA